MLVNQKYMYFNILKLFTRLHKIIEDHEKIWLQWHRRVLCHQDKVRHRQTNGLRLWRIPMFGVQHKLFIKRLILKINLLLFMLYYFIFCIWYLSHFTFYLFFLYNFKCTSIFVHLRNIFVRENQRHIKDSSIWSN